MKNETGGNSIRKNTIVALLLATGGVIVQILAGAHYPGVPPVFFLLLIPAVLMAVVHRRWVFAVSLLASCFLTLGLFSSGAYKRLFSANPADAAGLWIQSLAVGLVIIFSIAGIAQKERLDAQSM